VVVGDQVASELQIKVVWTDDEARATRASPVVVHYARQAELVESIQLGLRAREDGDGLVAERALGRAARLATATGHESTMRLLATVVDVDDAATERVRLKTDVERADEMRLDTDSTKTVRAEGLETTP
jgi:hypothetical protein